MHKQICLTIVLLASILLTGCGFESTREEGVISVENRL